MEKREADRFLCDFVSGGKISEARLGALSSADWDALLILALRFKVGGLLYREIKSGNFPAELIPEDVRNRLREAYRNVAILNTSLFLEASKVLKSFARDQLPVIVLKGLSLAKKIYGDIALRPMCDMDLLVKEEDLIRAGRILLTLGYKQDFPGWECTLKTCRHLPAFTNKNGEVIELHWNIVDLDSPIQADLDGLWKRACPAKVEDVETQVLSPEDLLLHLCIHACGHLESGIDLIPFCDIAGLIKKSGDKIDWPAVVERAKYWGGGKCVYLILLLVQELMKVAPPDGMMAEITPGDYRPFFLEKTLEQIFDDISSEHQTAASRLSELSKIKKIHGVKGKCAAFLEKTFPSKESLARKYPVAVSSPKIYLYYLIRLGRLIGSFAILLLRVFHRDPAVTKAADRAYRGSTISDWMYS